MGRAAPFFFPLGGPVRRLRDRRLSVAEAKSASLIEFRIFFAQFRERVAFAFGEPLDEDAHAALFPGGLRGADEARGGFAAPTRKNRNELFALEGVVRVKERHVGDDPRAQHGGVFGGNEAVEAQRLLPEEIDGSIAL